MTTLFVHGSCSKHDAIIPALYFILGYLYQYSRYFSSFVHIVSMSCSRLCVLQQSIFKKISCKLMNGIPRNAFISSFILPLSTPNKLFYFNRIRESVQSEGIAPPLTVENIFDHYTGRHDSKRMDEEHYLQMMNNFDFAETVNIAKDLGIQWATSPLATNHNENTLNASVNAAAHANGLDNSEFIIQPTSTDKTISLSSDSRAEYEEFMESIRDSERIIPEYQPFNPSHKYVGTSLNRLDAEIAFLENRKRLKEIRTKKSWFDNDADDLTSNFEWFQSIRNLMLFGSFLIVSKWIFESTRRNCPICKDLN